MARHSIAVGAWRRRSVESSASISARQALFDWHIRWRGPAQNGGHTIHVGTNEHYVACSAPADGVTEDFR
jgi:hypothetical protein